MEWLLAAWNPMTLFIFAHRLQHLCRHACALQSRGHCIMFGRTIGVGR
jgi:hypothetical protein